ncbi:MAG: Sensor protein KdpD [Sodalis sp.]|nr:MAG: Sensor protein KdpD [Sodalis sp.]
MLEWLEMFKPRATGQCRHQVFGLDAALARRPAVILMDEFVYSNATGAQHPKRCQAVEELLETGIDMLTTVKKHLESLNDVVGVA